VLASTYQKVSGDYTNTGEHEDWERVPVCIMGFELRPKNIIDNPSDADLRRMAIDQGGVSPQVGTL